ncbi:MAG: hypothetical protein KDE20_22300, partial [Caldilineaceae bacterium]|nr:hypothetical protein [Caldilineaceae bacterium]
QEADQLCIWFGNAYSKLDAPSRIRGLSLLCYEYSAEAASEIQHQVSKKERNVLIELQLIIERVSRSQPSLR